MSRESRITTKLSKVIDGKSILGHATGPKRKISIVEIIPTINNKQLTIRALAQGTKLYSLIMVLYGVEYSKSQNVGFPLTVTFKDGSTAWARQLRIDSTTAQIRCSCPDFYYTWSWYDKQNKVLSGPAMKPYQRKTTTHPERNPLKVPGMCKHILGLVDRLKESKILI